MNYKLQSSINYKHLSTIVADYEQVARAWAKVSGWCKPRTKKLLTRVNTTRGWAGICGKLPKTSVPQTVLPCSAYPLALPHG